MAKKLTEGDEIWALNGYTMEELGVSTHEQFAQQVQQINQRPLYITFISEEELNKNGAAASGPALGGKLATTLPPEMY